MKCVTESYSGHRLGLQVSTAASRHAREVDLPLDVQAAATIVVLSLTRSRRDICRICLGHGRMFMLMKS